MTRRVLVSVRGVVQGVGFRPFVYGLACRLGLSGHVLNGPEGVEIEVEGGGDNVDTFLCEIEASAPALARITEVQARDLDAVGEDSFVIRDSDYDGDRQVLISPDQATCEDCLRELRDPNDRRHRYPFINCTNCGPRYTIIRDMPYDRVRTTMADFDMCEACRAEYTDPSNRRFHAEPVCCPECGPRVWLADASGEDLSCEDPVAEAVGRLEAGEILAIKGIGGFHLACNASDEAAVGRLRERKHRDLKPFALMVKDLDAVKEICEPRTGAFSVIESSERPIVLLGKREGNAIAGGVAPRSDSFGVMLPYTPLHAMLMEGSYGALVMTSGNVSDEPIAFENEDALERLGEIADCFVLNDRDIHIRTDDSVVRVISDKLRFLRRSRGYAPFPVRLDTDTGGQDILAVGAELNNTLCLTRGQDAFLSHHIGDLKNVPSYESFLQAAEHLKSVLAVNPVTVACDLHPQYMSTKYAVESGLRLERVQHHHAHVASVLAENGRTDKVIGVSFDGMGYGDDGALWGGEFFVCDLAGYERVAHLGSLPQPGGDSAAKRPDRMAYVYLKAAYGKKGRDVSYVMLPSLEKSEMHTLDQLLITRVNCPMATSVGRLFDAASAILGVCVENTYHAQAPMELEAKAAAVSGEFGYYDAGIECLDDKTFVVLGSVLIKNMVEDKLEGTDIARCAARFHNSVASFTLDICRRIRDNYSVSTVALSGGVFANAFLLERLVQLLDESGFEVLLNSQAPCGDGGVSLGQAAVAAWRSKCV